MSEAVIIFDKVCKSYPFYQSIKGGFKNFLIHLPKTLHGMKKTRFEVLHDISFKVYKGETFGIIGRNGAGKSTILGLIAGVLKPSKGSIAVKGKISPLLELGGGFHPDLNGKENILMNGVLLGLTKNKVLQKMDKIIQFSEIGDFINQPIRTYSSGMVARLGFSIIAYLDPEILLIDEGLAVGDIEFQKKCVNKAMEFKKSGVTIVFVSHSVNLIKKICDRVMWIESHTIKMIGEPDVILNGYERIA